jgi:Ion channel/Pentapeptide repeats (8 copies)
MANEEHVGRLMQGVQAWNDWRTSNPDIAVDISGADLRGRDLTGVNLSGANRSSPNPTLSNLKGTNLTSAKLAGADFTLADLNQANLTDANLSDARLIFTNLTDAYLMGTNLTKALVIKSNLTEANLTGADLTSANLYDSNIAGATFLLANLTDVQVTDVKWNPRKMRRRWKSVRGLDSCWGNALFKRAAADQDFIDTLEQHWRGTWAIVLFWLWGLSTDYGRSLQRVASMGFVIAMLYGLTYTWWPEMLSYQRPPTWFTPFYFSIVTFTTLGFGDVVPASAIGEIVVSTEVALGYVTLGLLLAVLADKLARRS